MSSDTYKAVLDGLQVETNPSFLRRDVTGDKVPETFCNRAVEAACKALGAPLAPGILAREQLAWLDSSAARTAGWVECHAHIANAHADCGHPTVVGWTNPDPKVSSHVAMLRSPGRIWQAGRNNYNDTPLVNGFGARPVRYFVWLRETASAKTFCL